MHVNIHRGCVVKTGHGKDHNKFHLPFCLEWEETGATEWKHVEETAEELLKRSRSSLQSGSISTSLGKRQLKPKALDPAAAQTDRRCPLSRSRTARKRDRKLCPRKIADAILDGPKKFEDRGLLTWHDNIEELKPWATSADSDTETTLQSHGTAPGNEESEGRDKDFGGYRGQLAHRKKVTDLLESMQLVISRESTKSGRGHHSGKTKDDKNFQQKRMRLGETLWALCRELLPHLQDRIGSFLEYLAIAEPKHFNIEDSRWHKLTNEDARKLGIAVFQEILRDIAGLKHRIPRKQWLDPVQLTAESGSRHWEVEAEVLLGRDEGGASASLIGSREYSTAVASETTMLQHSATARTTLGMPQIQIDGVEASRQGPQPAALSHSSALGNPEGTDGQPEVNGSASRAMGGPFERNPAYQNENNTSVTQPLDGDSSGIIRTETHPTFIEHPNLLSGLVSGPAQLFASDQAMDWLGWERGIEHMDWQGWETTCNGMDWRGWETSVSDCV